MTITFKTLLIIAGLIGSAMSLVLPVTKCHLEDSKCMVNSVQQGIPLFINGIPDLNIDAMDAMEFDNEVRIDLAGLSLNFTEGRLEGLKSAVCKDVKWETDKNMVYVEFLLPSYFISGKYKADGKILVLPIVGDGQLEIKIENGIIKLTFYLDEQKKDGKTYVSIRKYTYDYQVEGGAKIELTNLFNGNKELSDTTLTFINDNWKEVINEFGAPLINAIANKIVKNCNKYLSKSAMEDIALI